MKKKIILVGGAVIFMLSFVLVFGYRLFMGGYIFKNDKRYDVLVMDENFDVATVQSPDETHKLFLTALKKKDFDKAVSCCFAKSEWKNRKDFLSGVKQRGMLDSMISDLTIIKKESMGSGFAVYSYVGSKDGNKVNSLVEFRKDKRGVWLISSL